MMGVFKDRRTGEDLSLSTGRPTDKHLVGKMPSKKKPLDMARAQAYANLVAAIFKDNPYMSAEESEEKTAKAQEILFGTTPDVMGGPSSFTSDAEDPEVTTDPFTGDVHAETERETN